MSFIYLERFDLSFTRRNSENAFNFDSRFILFKVVHKFFQDMRNWIINIFAIIFVVPVHNLKQRNTKDTLVVPY